MVLIMEAEATNLLCCHNCFDTSSKSFCHEDKEEGGEGIPFPNASIRGERDVRRSISKDGEKRSGEKGEHPFDLGIRESKSLQGMLDILPAYFAKGFGKV
jgi:hypothetical protein